MIKKALKGWKKFREQMTWNDYAKNISDENRDIMAAIFSELRRNGFMNPRVREDRIIVDYVCHHSQAKNPETHDLCTLCERECGIMDWKGIFKVDIHGNSLERCWQ